MRAVARSGSNRTSNATGVNIASGSAAHVAAVTPAGQMRWRASHGRSWKEMAAHSPDSASQYRLMRISSSRVKGLRPASMASTHRTLRIWAEARWREPQTCGMLA